MSNLVTNVVKNDVERRSAAGDDEES
jgi:ribosome-binding factor A